MDEGAIVPPRNHDTLILFSADACRPGRRLAERLNILASPGRFNLVTVDTDRSPALTRRYGVSAIPSIVLFRRGQEVVRRLGELSAADLDGWLAEVLAAG